MKCKCRGFSLIEVLVALTILGLVLLPFMSFLSYRISKERRTDELTEALELCRSAMEEALLTPDVSDSETIIEQKYRLAIEVLESTQFNESQVTPPKEIHVTVFLVSDNAMLAELRALK